MRGEEGGARLSGVSLQAAAFLLAEAGHVPGGGVAAPCIVLVKDNDTLDALVADLRFFLSLDPDAAPVPVLRYPADEVNPYCGIAPDRADVSERLGALHLISRGEPFGFLLVAAAAALKRVMPPHVLSSAGDYVITGVEVDRERLIASLLRGGYLRVPVVDGPGQFAARGGIIDVYSPLYPHPVRAEFLGDTVDRMRFFEPETQRTFRDAPELYAPPVSELIAAEAGREAAAREAQAIGERINTPTRRLSELLDEIEGADPRKYPPALLPAYYSGTAVLADYLGAYARTVRTFAVEPGDARAAAEEFIAEAGRDLGIAEAAGTPCLPVDRHFAPPDALDALIGKPGTVHLSMLPDVSGSDTDVSDSFNNTRVLRDEMERVRGRKDEDPLAPLVTALDEWNAVGREVVAACPSHEQAERLSFLLGERKIPVRKGPGSGGLRIVSGKLSAGLATARRVFVPEEEIFGERAKRHAPRAALKTLAASLHELKDGDHVVHVQHGIGLYRGLKRLALWGVENDFLQIEYREGAKLYVPVQRLSVITRYQSPGGGAPRIDRLGGNAWEKTKARVKDAVLGMASELIRLHAMRKTAGGHAYPPPDDYFTEFCASFEFEETPDQLRAVDEVLADMQAQEPMDRLVCGDVGYGKTEVAVRAAFKAVQDGRQVAVLVPTTVLAQQHWRTFKRRFDKFPLSVGLLSRFVPAAAQKKTVAGLAAGTVDVVIGTHRMLQKDVSFKGLGLIIIDEEHRFGVAHKERFKKFAAGVDILTLTATPIPRTLHMAMGGLKDLSLISTPPPDRLAVRTFVAKFDPPTIREAVMREFARGGQVFFVHDRVMSMPGMKKFTTIIGAGLDITAANTIIIHRADMLGLSQLYQLRGRVGRGRERAYAYLFVPRFGNLAPDAKKRLETMYEFQQLGSGFNVAMQDLELRGAGNLLGPTQHGHVMAVGFDLYAELLEEAVAELGGREAVQRVEPEVRLPVPSFIPEKYVGDVPLRLDYYQKMVYANDPGEIGAIVEEMQDRFGEAPAEVHNLADVMSLTIDLRALDVEALEYGKGNVALRFAKNARVNPAHVVAWVQKHAKDTRLTADGRLICAIGDVPLDDLTRTIHRWVKELASAL